MGIDFIYRFHLNYDTKTRGFFWKKTNNWQKGSIRAKKTQTLDSHPKFVTSVESSKEAQKRLSQPLTPEKEAYIRKAANLEHVPEHLRKAYINLRLKHHTAMS